MTLRTRLVLTIGGVALLLVLPAAYAAWHLRDLRDIAEGVSLSHGRAYSALGGLFSELAEAERLERTYVALPAEPHRIEARDQALARARAHVRTLRDADYSNYAIEVARRLDRIDAEIRYLDGILASEAQAPEP